MTTIVGFPPIAESNAILLILGTMPGKVSLLEYQYYAHPQNSFWYIVERLFSPDANLDYEKRTEILKKNKIAVWDVVNACTRQGSLDASIETSSIVENDFESFFAGHPNIKSVFFNGATAEKEYKKRVLPKISRCFKYYRLPSTSPAMARMTKEEKLLKWMIVKEQVTVFQG